MIGSALGGFAQGLAGGLSQGRSIRNMQRQQVSDAAEAAAPVNPSPPREGGDMRAGPVRGLEAAAPATTAAPPVEAGPRRSSGFRPSRVDPRIAMGLRDAANELGVDPADLATVVSYETGGTFDPAKPGPKTKWGRHKGLIQFGEPQAQEYGVDWDRPIESQVGRDGAIVRYMRDRGVKPGMKLADIYSTVNAGAPGRMDASDEAAGGAPGTVADKVAGMDDHRRQAESLLQYYEITDPAMRAAVAGYNGRSLGAGA